MRTVEHAFSCFISLLGAPSDSSYGRRSGPDCGPPAGAVNTIHRICSSTDTWASASGYA